MDGGKADVSADAPRGKGEVAGIVYIPWRPSDRAGICFKEELMACE